MDSSIVPVRSAEMPTLNDLAATIVRELDSDAPFHTLWPVVVEMAKELGDQNIQCNNVIDAFTDDDSQDNMELRLLFHTIHPKTLRSLVLGRLPHDLYKRNLPGWSMVYHREGAGAYLMGVVIEGREGAFLNKREILKVIELLEEYKNGCIAWNQYQIDDPYSHSQVSYPQSAAIKKALLIDNEMEKQADRWQNGENFCQPKCISGKGNVTNIDALNDMLQRRIDNQFDDEAYQESSPVYVGCGRRIPKRMLNHHPDYSQLLSSSKMLRLLLSCIRYIGLVPEVVGVPIVMAWKQSQIGLCESLVTVLARSLITLGGLNVIKPGTVPSEGDDNTHFYDKIKEDVWVTYPWFGENVNRSQEYLDGTDISRRALETIRHNYPSTDNMKETMEGIKDFRRRMEAAEEEFPKAAEAAKERTRRMKESNDENARLLEIINGMHADFSDSDSEESESEEGEDVDHGKGKSRFKSDSKEMDSVDNNAENEGDDSEDNNLDDDGESDEDDNEY